MSRSIDIDIPFYTMELSLIVPIISIGGYAKNNLSVIIYTMITGLLSFGLLSSLILFSNGFLASIAMMTALKSKPISWVLLSLIPHGIFEIPALLIAGAVGFKSAEWCIKKVRSVPTLQIGRDTLIAISISIILVLIAAVIESMITPLFI